MHCYLATALPSTFHTKPKFKWFDMSRQWCRHWTHSTHNRQVLSIYLMYTQDLYHKYNYLLFNKQKKQHRFERIDFDFFEISDIVLLRSYLYKLFVCQKSSQTWLEILSYFFFIVLESDVLCRLLNFLSGRRAKITILENIQLNWQAKRINSIWS